MAGSHWMLWKWIVFCHWRTLSICFWSRNYTNNEKSCLGSNEWQKNEDINEWSDFCRFMVMFWIKKGMVFKTTCWPFASLIHNGCVHANFEPWAVCYQNSLRKKLKFCFRFIGTCLWCIQFDASLCEEKKHILLVTIVKKSYKISTDVAVDLYLYERSLDTSLKSIF